MEQVYSSDKNQKAAEWLAARARENGSLTAEEIQGLIEAALRQLKDAFRK
ncbi:phage holin, LLH family [Kyrpidia sp.]|nr:phage holin, LLH family [Kyrpidia sp.]MCL6576675.1 hypothetical protein [Kyrpidia sp.]